MSGSKSGSNPGFSFIADCGFADQAAGKSEFLHKSPSTDELFCMREAASGRETKRCHGFTLVECLFAMFLMAMVLPAVNLGIAAATRSASTARHRTEAAGLASSKLSELIASAQWQGGSLSGDFGNDWPDYHWNATVQNWVNDTQGVGLQELDVTVTWPAKGPQQSVMVSGLVYVRPTPTS